VAAVPGPISYPVATWVAPTVPTVSLLGLVALGSGVDDPASGFATGLVIGLVLLVLGAAAAMVPGPRARHLRGLGLGVAVGAAVTCLGWVLVLAT